MEHLNELLNRPLKALMLACSVTLAGGALAQAQLNQPAPAFTATDIAGKSVNLSEFQGKYVVLEWVNPGCPFVQKHYNSGNMQSLQKEAATKGVVWLSVASNAKGAEGYQSPTALAAWMKGKSAAQTGVLVDSDGKLGRAFGARATPHMYVISPQGTLIYAGGIDNKPTTNPADIAGATNYVRQALNEALAGKAVSRAAAPAYGCGIEYAPGA